MNYKKQHVKWIYLDAARARASNRVREREMMPPEKQTYRWENNDQRKITKHNDTGSDTKHTLLHTERILWNDTKWGICMPFYWLNEMSESNLILCYLVL